MLSTFAQEPRQEDCVGPRSFRRGHPGRAQSSSTHSSSGRSKLPKGNSEIDAAMKDIVWPLGEFVVSFRSKDTCADRANVGLSLSFAEDGVDVSEYVSAGALTAWVSFAVLRCCHSLTAFFVVVEFVANHCD